MVWSMVTILIECKPVRVVAAIGVAGKGLDAVARVSRGRARGGEGALLASDVV